MSYEMVIFLVFLCGILLCSILGGVGIALHAKYIDKKIEKEYPDYLRARHVASICDKEAGAYFMKHVRKYEKEIEKKENELRWLPKEERDEIIEEIETLKKQRLVYYTNYVNMREDAKEKWERVNAIVNSHPFLRKHRG